VRAYRLKLQRLMSDALGVRVPLAFGFDLAAPGELAATLNVGATKRLYRQALANGTTAYVRDDEGLPAGAAGSTLNEADSAALVPVVMIVHSFPRSFLQIRHELAPLVTAATAVDAQRHAGALKTTASSAQRRALQQVAGDSSGVPVFGMIDATANAMARCGNGVCEFGEAVGTWAFPEAWNCPQDCPFELQQCPSQVRTARPADISLGAMCAVVGCCWIAHACSCRLQAFVIEQRMSALTHCTTNCRRKDASARLTGRAASAACARSGAARAAATVATRAPTAASARAATRESASTAPPTTPRARGRGGARSGGSGCCYRCWSAARAAAAQPHGSQPLAAGAQPRRAAAAASSRALRT
jgi:hypothetical protein